MPGPPTEIRIKRKATDDPVDLLHVQNEYNGIRQIKQYVFKRQRISAVPNNNIISFTGGHKVAGLDVPKSTDAYKSNGYGIALQVESAPIVETAFAPKNSSTGTEVSETHSAAPQSEPRRFHLSRDSIHNHGGRMRGARGLPAIFIERRRPVERMPKISNAETHTVDRKSESLSIREQESGREEAQLPPPLLNAQSSVPAPLHNVQLPSGRVVPWDADSSTLAAEMQAYTLQEIGRNLSKISTTENLATPTPMIKARQVSSFKPKAPPLRYHERHPEHARTTDEEKEPGQDEIMTDAADVEGDESGYIMDTYVRMPAEMFEFQEQKSVGFLVLDSQPDVDEFYNDESDSDSEVYDEEEDENAENHPSTDYPEDEVDLDDEYGRNPYQLYRNRNSSDNEEYDEDNVTYSDDEAKPPWARRPWMVLNPYCENEENDEDDY